jgi:hypothetical protein
MYLRVSEDENVGLPGESQPYCKRLFLAVGSGGFTATFSKEGVELLSLLVPPS